ncbi:glycosyl transferase [Virgisporangium aliadipatigenens]|uniref:Glycosyl transferase n=1 Tax=Virgisporangium aliadipatigenens TaxID=741659 RepID=A0A8J3YFR0_9ACTN|nr:glycosyltransferase family 4 protein [Virgisporangium aliadipatigenens]GIJ44176.1 glycosyl transferase [Virgisporangium aliadipatigenens]
MAQRTGWRPLRIAMIGQKGVPATHGGIERHVEEISTRLVALGHDVTVYCRTNYGAEAADGARDLGPVRLRPVRTVSSKHLDAIVHSGLSTMLAVGARPDIVHYHGLGPGLVAPLPRVLSRARIVQTVHGLDNQRAKWGRGAQSVLGLAYRMSGRVPHARVAVSQWLAAHYDQRFGSLTRYLPNGVNEPKHLPPGEISERFGLLPGRYALLVGRLVPEKSADLLIRAFRRVDNDRYKLAIVGGSSYTDEFVAELQRLADGDPRIVLTGYAYGDVLAELYSNAALFVQPSHVEGLPLTLLEAVSYGLPVVASDIPPHREVLVRDGLGRRMFRDGDEEDLVRVLSTALADTMGESEGVFDYRDRVMAHYHWDDVTRELEHLYLDLVS